MAKSHRDYIVYRLVNVYPSPVYEIVCRCYKRDILLYSRLNPDLVFVHESNMYEFEFNSNYEILRKELPF